MAEKRRRRAADIEPVYVVLGGVLRKARRTQGRTLASVARRAGMNPTSLQYFETAQSRMTIPQLVRLCACLERDPLWVLAEALRIAESVTKEKT